MTEQEMMENWMRHATPGPQHEKLVKHCGDYNVTMIERGQEMSGEAKIEMILGGRVQTQHFTMDFQGMPFVGYGMWGYDNFTNRHWFTWNDNMSTGISQLWGSEQDGGRKIVFEGKLDKAGMNLKQVPVRHTFTLKSENEFRFEAWDYPDTEKESKVMDMTYTRKR